MSRIKGYKVDSSLRSPARIVLQTVQTVLTCCCGSCSSSIPGCTTCTSSNACARYTKKGHRIGTPPGGQTGCPCINDYYQADSGSCVVCPVSKQCQTCEYNSDTNEVDCTSCLCLQNRVVNPTSKTCVYAAGYVVLPGSPYCLAAAPAA